MFFIPKIVNVNDKIFNYFLFFYFFQTIKKIIQIK